MNSKLGDRLIKGIGANAFGQLVSIIIQVLGVPIFIHSWGIGLYGEWLVISAIPAYLALSDIGFGNVAANEMTMLVAQGERQTALSIFQSIWILITGISIGIIVFLSVTVWTLPLTNWLKFTYISHQEAAIVVFLLSLHILIGQQSSLISAGFRCEGNFARGAMCSNFLRLSEFAAIAVAVCFQSTPVYAALSFLLVRSMGTLLMAIDMCQCSPWLIYGYRFASKAVVKRMLSPAIAFLSFPLGNALSIQGMVIAVGSLLGANTVVLFSTLRTLSRLVWQILNTINNAVWPEISMAFGTQNLELARKLHRHSCQLAFWLAITAVAILSMTGSSILYIWTGGKVAMNMPVFGIMLVVVLANSLWSTSQIVPLAINKHQQLAFYYLYSTFASLVLALLLMPFLGLIGAAVALLVIDVVMSIYVVRNSLNLVQDRFRDFSRVLITPPTRQLLSGWQI